MAAKKTPVVSTAHYLRLLDGVAKKAKATLAREVIGPDGEPLFTKGAPYDATVLDAVENRLVDPLHLELSLGAELDASGLRKVFLTALGGCADFREIHLATKLETTLMVVIGRVKLSAKMREHLAVMRVAHPVRFTKTILGAWLALAIGKQLQLEKRELDALFTGALCRDLGMLYVRPALLEVDTARMSVADRDDLEQHVQYSQVVAKTVEGGISEDVVRIVGCHHERVDRSGYPSRLSGDKLDLPSRIVALSDVVVALRCREEGVQLGDVVIRLLLEREAYDSGVFETFRGLVRILGDADEGPEELELRVETLMSRAKLVADGAAEVETRLKWALQCSRKIPPQVIIRARRILATLRRSGLADKELGWWLKQVGAKREEASAADLRELEMQQLELLRQLSRLEDELGNGGGDVVSAADLTRSNVIG